jgi:hypothetical protein
LEKGALAWCRDWWRTATPAITTTAIKIDAELDWRIDSHWQIRLKYTDYRAEDSSADTQEWPCLGSGGFLIIHNY